jgi:hypothetical protein
MRFALLFVTMLAAPLACQEPQDAPEPTRLPSGKLQVDEILKADHQRALRDVDRIGKLAAELKAELEKDGYNVYSLDAEKKAAQIEKLAKHVRASIRRQ